MRRLVTLLPILILLMLVASCGIPGFGDDDESSGTTPVPTLADIPEQPSEPDEAEVEAGEDGWTVHSAPARQPAPESRAPDDVLRLLGSTDPPDTLDPALVRDTTSSFLTRQLFRGLVRFNTDLEPVPDLAREIRISPDNMTYRVQLHDGLSFHDGQPVTAGDVKSSMERAGDPALLDGDVATLPSYNYLEHIEGAQERMSGERDDISGIEIIDERTLEIQLKLPVVDFMSRLANPTLFVVDVDQASGEPEWWRTPNGSGPFRLEEWDPERVMRLTPHDGYVRPPVVSEVNIRVGREAVGGLQQFENGQLDAVPISTSVVDRFDYAGALPDAELRVIPMLSTTFAMINPNIPPFDDERLRRALIMGFPAEKVPNVMHDGRTRVARGMLPPEMDPSPEGEMPLAYDESQARALLNAFRSTTQHDSITIFTSGGSIPAALKRIYERYEMIDVEVIQLRWSDYLDDLDNRHVPYFVLGWVADDPEPVSFLHSLFHSDSPDNYADYSNPEVDELLDAALVEPDEDARADLLDEAHERILNSAIVMPLYHGVDYMLVANHVDGLQTTPMGILGLETVRFSR